MCAREVMQTVIIVQQGFYHVLKEKRPVQVSKVSLQPVTGTHHPLHLMEQWEKHPS